MLRRLVKNQLKGRYPSNSMRGILTSALGSSGNENVHLHNSHSPNLNISQNDDSRSTIKILKDEIEKLKIEVGCLRQCIGDRSLSNHVDNGEETIYIPPLQHTREAFALFDQMLESKIKSEGEDILKVSKPFELFEKLDLEELKQKYPYVKENEYMFVVENRFILFQLCKDIEIRHKLMQFLVKNEYEKFYKEGKGKRLGRHKQAELDQILSEIITYPNDSILRSRFETDPHLDCTIHRYLYLLQQGGDEIRSKEDRLTMVKDDRDAALFKHKKWYRNVVALGFSDDYPYYSDFVKEIAQYPDVRGEGFLRLNF